jgi:small subunit ribosomal protein S5
MSEEKNNIDQGQVDNKNKSFENRAKKPFSGKKRFADRPKEEFEQRILDVARVTRVMKGGKRMSFRTCVAIGDKKGRVAVALGKGADVTLAVNKAVNKAKKNIVHVPIVNDTIPHEIYEKFGSAKILIKPASKGRGVIAGGVVRVVLDLAGVKNVSSKILGTNNKVNNAKCTVLALSKLRKVSGSIIKKSEEAGKDDKNDNSKSLEKK